MRALVLAAGVGRRLGAESKPLSLVAGRPLLMHVLDRLAEGGVSEAVVVTGHRAEAVRHGIASGAPKLSVHFVEHPDFDAGNGRSLLAAASWVPSSGTVLIMGDHLHTPATIAGLVGAKPVQTTLVVDPRPALCPDLAEATKVAIDAGWVTAIGKNLDVYDAVDTGLFWICPDLVGVLREAQAERGDCTVSDGVARLARGRRVAARPSTAAWLDMDTPADLVRAEGLVRRERGGKVQVR